MVCGAMPLPESIKLQCILKFAECIANAILQVSVYWNHYCIAIEYMFRKNQNHKLNSLCAANPTSFNLRVVGIEEDKDTTDTFSGIALRVLFMICLNTATV